jgi:hypothetical protein
MAFLRDSYDKHLNRRNRQTNVEFVYLNALIIRFIHQYKTASLPPSFTRYLRNKNVLTGRSW